METIPQKLRRKLKEFLAWIRYIVKTMSADERKVVAILVMIAAIFAIVGGLVWSTIANAETKVSFTCPRDYNFCYGNKGHFEDLIEYNQAMAKELRIRQSCSDKNSI